MGRKRTVFPLVLKRGSVTVKIYRTPSHGCDSFTLSYYQDGARKRPTFSTFEDAKAEAETVLGRLASSDADVLTLTSADRAAYLRARQLLDPLGVSIEMAAAQVAEARKELGDVALSTAVHFYVKRHPRQLVPRPVQAVVAELLAAKKADGLSKRYLQTLRHYLGKFAATFHCNIGSVSGADIDRWLRESELAPRTRNNLRNSVQTLFTFAKARQYLPKDHDELDAVPLAKDRDGEIEIFTPAELVEILNCAQDHLVPFLTLGAFAGIRHAEIQRLDWKDIRFDDGIIEVGASKAKTASRRTVPLLENLRGWLLPHRQAAGPVCPLRNMAFELHQLVQRVNQGRRQGWARANRVTPEELEANEARVKKGAKATKTRRRQRGEVPPGAATAELEGWLPFAWKHNALRHSFISYRVAQTQNVAQVSLEAGNSPQVVFRNYRELVRPADAKAWFSIGPGADGNIVPLKPLKKADGTAVEEQAKRAAVATTT